MARYAVRVVALSVSLVGLALVPVAAARAETATFSFTGAEQTYTVPAGVSTLRIVAIGGAGGAPSQFGGAGGKAGAVGADLAVTPGENLLVVVGGNGGNGVDGLGDGGFNGGATGGKSTAAAGGGGGASDVRLLPLVDPGSPATRLVVAGGGGGAGTVVTSTETAVGGDAGMDGSNSIFASYGGRAGTATSGGLGGAAGGGAGVLAGGGRGGGGPACVSASFYPGGGGGGGIYGGGGGGCNMNLGGGGGGGSSGALSPRATNVTTALDSSGTPRVLITPGPAATPALPPGPAATPAFPPGPAPSGGVPTSAFSVGTAVARPDGSIRLPVNLPAAGAVEARAAFRGVTRRPGKEPKSVTSTYARGSAAVAGAGPRALRLIPTGSGREVLRRRGSLRLTITVRFTPGGGTPASRTVTLTLRRR